MAYATLNRRLSLATVLGFAGFISAQLSICAPSVLHKPVDILIGTLFGAALSVCLWFLNVVRPLWKLLVITAASSIILPIAALIGAYLEYFSPWPLHTPGTPLANTSNAALFVAGVSGAFFLLAVLFLLVSSEQPARKVLFKALCWAPVGGALGVVGWNLGPWLGTALWSLQYHLNLTSPNDKLEYAVRQGRTGVDSLLVVWQMGMGFLLGITLRELRIPTLKSSTPV
jgi:hypothetical protein